MDDCFLEFAEFRDDGCEFDELADLGTDEGVDCHIMAGLIIIYMYEVVFRVDRVDVSGF